MADKGTAGLENAISKLMSNPTLMAAVNEAVAGMKKPQGDSAQGSGDSSPAEEAEGKAPDTEKDETARSASATPGGLPFDPSMLAAFSSMLGGLNIGSGSPGRHGGSGDEERKRRCALLSALKPYLNPHRRETIDYMLGIDRLSDALHTVKKP